jgi:adhesin transport system membrane fusion protein
VAISQEMLNRDLTSRMVHLDLTRQMQILKTQIESDRAMIPRLTSALSEANERRAALRETSREQTQKELAQALQALEELNQRAAKFRNARDRTILKSSVEGVIKTLAVTTEGGVVQPGATVVEIVPIEDRLEIEARLPVQDVGFVRQGQPVRITLSSSDASIFAPMNGEVLQVAPDAAVDRDGRPFYRIRVLSHASRFIAPGLVYDLHPGMQVVCSIRIGHRTILGYVLGPWLHAARFAVEER